MRLQVCICLLGLAGIAAAQSNQFSYPNFSGATTISLRGSAAQVGGLVRVTPDAPNQTGAFWHDTAMPVLGGFDTTFTFRITPPVVGRIAEGMAFVIQNSAQGASALGGGVWALGYGSNGAPSIRNALAIELVDTYLDPFLGDTSNNEISVHTGGTSGCEEDESASIGRVTPLINVGNGQIHTARILYVPGTLQIFVNNLTTPVLTVPYDFQTGARRLNGTQVGGLDLPNATAFLGFTSATGAGTLTEQVDILSWTWTSMPGTDPCMEGTVNAQAGAPVDVLQLNGSSGGYFRTVTMNAFGSLDIAVDAPPAAASADFILALQPGSNVQPFATGIGDFCFNPLAPGSLIFAETLGIRGGGLVPATAAPWAINFPTGPTVPTTIMVQGLISDPSATQQFSLTNAVILDVVLGAPPTITRVLPGSALPGGTIAITGTDFEQLAQVTIDGVPVTVTSSTPTQLDIIYPAGVACDATLVVTNPDGQTASAAINPTPAVTRVFPASGPAAGGTSVLFIGSGFSAGTVVQLGGVSLPLTLAQPNAVRVTTPAHPAGPATFTITTPGGCVTTASFTFN